MKKKIVCLTAFFILLFLYNVQINITADTLDPITTTTNVPLLEDAKTGILIEFQTGKILYEQDAHERRTPASMTKIMTMYLILEAIDNGKINWDDMITVSEYASSMGGSQVWLAHNEKMSVKDLFKCLAIVSANDAAVALAEAVSGSEELFVSAMNNKVQELGLKNTYFKDVTGLTEMSEGHYSSAYDMAMMSRALLHDYPVVTEYTSLYEDYVRNGESWLVTTNKLVKFHKGLDGLKTGWIRESGYNLTATQVKENMRLISTVMGNSSGAKRSNETMKLLNYGFSLYEVKEYKPVGYEVTEYKSIFMNPAKVKIVTKEPVYFVVKKGQELSDLEEHYTITMESYDYKKGDVVGNYHLKEKNGKIVYEVGLTVSEDVEKASLFTLFFRNIVEILFG